MATVKGLIRQLAGKFDQAESVEVPPELNPRHELLTVPGLPGLTELSRLGMSYIGKGATTQVGLAAATPSTVFNGLLWNGEAQNGKSYIVTAAGITTDTSGAAAAFLQCFGEMSILPIAINPETLDPTSVVRCLAAGKVYGGKARFSTNVTTLTDNGWFPIGQPILSPLATTIAFSVGGLLDEVCIIPPGHWFAVQMVGNSTAAGSPWYKWHEVQLPIAS